MLGEIDLSVGSMSGLSSAIVGVLWVNAGWPVAAAIAVALLCGIAVGLLYALLYNRVGMPSFVATLAGLLALLGLQLYILGPSGSINLPYASPLVRFGQLLVMPGWFSHLMALLPGLAILIFGLKTRTRRLAANLSAEAVSSLLLRAILLTVIFEAAVFYLNLGRGVPWIFGLFVALVMMLNYALKRTQWGALCLPSAATAKPRAVQGSTCGLFTSAPLYSVAPSPPSAAFWPLPGWPRRASRPGPVT